MTKQNSRPFRNISRLAFALFIGICSTPLGAGAQTADTQVQPPPPADAGTAITGFRNAKFGMSQTEVLAAINAEFKIPGSAVKHSANSVQRTELLTACVPDLFPGSGTANVSYIFGYQTHKLIEINILWSQATDPKITAGTLYQNGESLQQYFAGAGFAADRSTGNIATSDGIILFRTTDPASNAILLILSGVVKKDSKTNKGTLYPTALTLAYAADPLHPDVFSLPKGSF